MLKEDTEKKLKIIRFQYETKLQEESDALYTRMNDKIKNLENCYKEVCFQVSSVMIINYYCFDLHFNLVSVLFEEIKCSPEKLSAAAL